MRPAPAGFPSDAAAPAWRPGWLLSSQLLVQGAALVWLLMSPAHWLAALACVLLSQTFLMAICLWPRSQWLGPNLRQLPPASVARGEVAITIDDGPDPEVTPQVLEILAQHGAVATFFFIGSRAAAQPELCRKVVAAGHRVENHGARHPTLLSFALPAGWRREIFGGQQMLATVCGQTPRFYRAVAGLRNPFLDPVLHASGLQLASWTRRGFDTREREPSKVLQRLTRGLAAGDILLLHDGHAARSADGTPLIVAVLPDLLRALRQRNLIPVTLEQACKNS